MRSPFSRVRPRRNRCSSPECRYELSSDTAEFDATNEPLQMRLLRGLLIAGLILVPIESNSQSLLDRSPNMSGDWVGAPGTLFFNFVHRFTASDAPQRKVSNVPTFLIAAGLPAHLLAGLNYSTNSTLSPGFPNEWELFGRWAPMSQDVGSPLDLGAQVGYNNAAEGIDGEVSAARRLGRARLLVAGRALSSPIAGGSEQFAVAGGATFKLGQFLALAADVASMSDRTDEERIAWSAGVHFAIPMSPHTLSIHATNTTTTTLQGASRGSKNVRYGFEFTIPLTLRRYFGNHSEPVADTISRVAASATGTPTVTHDPSVTVAGPSAPQIDTLTRPPTIQSTPRSTTAPTSTPSTPPRSSTTAPAQKPVSTAKTVTRSGMKNITYLHSKLQITVGTTVEWTNRDPLPHTVTADDKSFDSGLIQPGKVYRHTFTRAGTFNFHCTPHPFMKGVVVVREP